MDDQTTYTKVVIVPESTQVIKIPLDVMIRNLNQKQIAQAILTTEITDLEKDIANARAQGIKTSAEVAQQKIDDAAAANVEVSDDREERR